jgi:hypothetical protein
MDVPVRSSGLESATTGALAASCGVVPEVEVCLAKANSHCQSGKTETSTTKKQIAETCTARIRAFFRSL